MTPRNVRNWWLTANIDGRKTQQVRGPAAAAGGFVLTIQQRDAGKPITVARLVGRAQPDGTLTLTLVDPLGQEHAKCVTHRTEPTGTAWTQPEELNQ